MPAHVHDLDCYPFVATHRKRPRFGLELELPRLNLYAKGLQVRSLFEVVEHLAIDKAVAVVILVQVPRGDIPGIGILVICCSLFPVEEKTAGET